MAVKKFTFDDFDFPDDIPHQEDVGMAMENVVVIEEEKEYNPNGQHPIVVLLLDCSGSMGATDSTEGVSRIELVKRYAEKFVNTPVISAVDKERVELCVIAFDSGVTILKDFGPMSDVNSDFSALQANGLTSLYTALIVGVQLARRRRNALMNDGAECFKPILFLVTDGAPTDSDLMEDCRKVLKHYVDKDDNGKAKMRLIICGMDQCNMTEMNNLCEDKQILALRDTDALQDAFKLLTASVAAVSQSNVTDDVHLAMDKISKKIGWLRGTSSVLNLN